MVEVRSGIIAFAGIGSNMGDPLARCREAIGHIAGVEGIELLRHSSFFKTEPVGIKDQEWFINAVIELRTILPARELLKALQVIEGRMGRMRGVRWGPRIIDIDILLYGQQVVHQEDIVIPHPEFHKRRFVLEPLHELAPYVIHPAFGVSIRGLMARLDDASRVEIYQP